MDLSDSTGRFEVLSRIPDTTFHVIRKDRNPIRDVRGLMLTRKSLLQTPLRTDVLVVPGGAGQEVLMDAEFTSSSIRDRGAM